jgi:hypothetical protein
VDTGGPCHAAAAYVDAVLRFPGVAAFRVQTGVAAFILSAPRQYSVLPCYQHPRRNPFGLADRGAPPPHPHPTHTGERGREGNLLSGSGLRRLKAPVTVSRQAHIGVGGLGLGVGPQPQDQRERRPWYLVARMRAAVGSRDPGHLNPSQWMDVCIQLPLWGRSTRRAETAPCWRAALLVEADTAGSKRSLQRGRSHPAAGRGRTGPGGAGAAHQQQQQSGPKSAAVGGTRTGQHLLQCCICICCAIAASGGTIRAAWSQHCLVCLMVIGSALAVLLRRPRRPPPRQPLPLPAAGPGPLPTMNDVCFPARCGLDAAVLWLRPGVPHAVHWHAPAAPTRWELVLLRLSSTIS